MRASRRSVKRWRVRRFRGHSFGYQRIGIGKRAQERDVIGCNHCRHQIVVQPDKGSDSPKMRLDRCGACSRTICPSCAAELATTMVCKPFEARLDQTERKAAALRALMREAGLVD